jgi:hypothetical protein
MHITGPRTVKSRKRKSGKDSEDDEKKGFAVKWFNLPKFPQKKWGFFVWGVRCLLSGIVETFSCVLANFILLKTLNDVDTHLMLGAFQKYQNYFASQQNQVHVSVIPPSRNSLLKELCFNCCGATVRQDRHELIWSQAHRIYLRGLRGLFRDQGRIYHWRRYWRLLLKFSWGGEDSKYGVHFEWEENWFNYFGSRYFDGEGD